MAASCLLAAGRTRCGMGSNHPSPDPCRGLGPLSYTRFPVFPAIYVPLVCLRFSCNSKMRFMSPASRNAWHDEQTRLIRRPIRSRSGTVAGLSPQISHIFFAISFLLSGILDAGYSGVLIIHRTTPLLPVGNTIAEPIAVNDGDKIIRHASPRSRPARSPGCRGVRSSRGLFSGAFPSPRGEKFFNVFLSVVNETANLPVGQV